MSKGKNQKLKMLRLLQLFIEYTNEERRLSRREIMSKLDVEYMVTSSESGLKEDIQLLIDNGFPINIVHNPGKSNLYYYSGHPFTVAETKMFIDLLQASNAIPEIITSELIQKLKELMGWANWEKVKRYRFDTGRAKTLNDECMMTVGVINDAINRERRISFKYYIWNSKMELREKHEGKIYDVSPVATVISDDRYYLIGYDHQSKMIKHYRIDKIKSAALTENKVRECNDLINEHKVAEYVMMNINMYSGDGPYRVTLSVSESMVNLLIDRFGTELIFTKCENRSGWVKTTVKTSVGRQFFGWLISQNDLVVLEGPEEIKERMKKEIKTFMEIYEQENAAER